MTDQVPAPPTGATVDRARLGALLAAETARFVDTHPNAGLAFERARRSQLSGVPMNWMTRWPGSFPVVVESATGSRLTDVDGHSYVDFCLGDTGAMAGHCPPPTVAAVASQVARAITTMLHPGRPVQRHRGTGARTRPRGRGVRAHRASADERRHRAAR